jgi:hypothetical protein
MREDQLRRLDDLSKKVAEVFIEEADPDNWNGAGAPLAEMDVKLRGNRYWDKKNALTTGTLLQRMLELMSKANKALGAAAPASDEEEEEIEKYENQAKRLIDALQSKSGTKSRG